MRTLAQQQTDTVYVVTGAILRTVTGNETITYIKPAKDTKNCPVPNYYYKVLLKVKREASGKISSASTVGVWLPHRVYSGESYQSYTKSVAEIEALTGQKLTIPSFARNSESTESLNVGVATGIILSEFKRRM